MFRFFRSLLGSAGVAGRDTESRRRAESQPNDSHVMKVLLGLGNPGAEYEHTRHNVGWWFLDYLAARWRLEGWRKDGDARIATGDVAQRRVRLVKPQTYMNLSGLALKPYVRRSGWVAASDLLVVVDEVALPGGRYRFRARGSAGGHNGLKSVESALAAQEYARLRIGIGPAAGRARREPLSEYVLDAAGKREAAVIRELFPTLGDAVELWLARGIEPTMNRYTGAAQRQENGA